MLNWINDSPCPRVANQIFHRVRMGAASLYRSNMRVGVEGEAKAADFDSPTARIERERGERTVSRP